MKSICIATLLVVYINSLAQNDTLNKCNSNDKKDGFWICYLDEKLKKTSKEKAIYYGYELFDNGTNLTHLGERNMRIYSVDIPTNLKNKPVPRLLEGTFVLANKKGDEKSVEQFKNGCPYIIKGLISDKTKKLNDFEQEHLDFTKKYQEEQGSFYWEERSTNLKDTTKYWFRKVDGKWKSVKIN